MPLVDLEQGGRVVDAASFYRKYLDPIVRQIPRSHYEEMLEIIDDALSGLQPSQQSQLVWTKCAALVGYDSDHPDADTVWQHAFAAVKGHPDACHQFVGSLIFWRIALYQDIWISAKTHDRNKVHPYRTYWINNNWQLPRPATVSDLAAKWGCRLN